MKKVSLILSAVVMTAMILSSCANGEITEEGASIEETTSTEEGVASEVTIGEEGASTEETTSTEEGVSSEVTIGEQVWMTENLNVDKFRNGDPIPEAKTDEEWIKARNYKQPAWCYYNNNPDNGDRYGKLYNWYAVNDPRGLAPKGWHVPSDEEWTVLTDYLGGRDVAGTKMKSKSGWAEDGNGTNESRFSGLPGGYRNDDGSFDFIGNYGTWWSSTEDGTYNAWSRYLYYNGGYVSSYSANKGDGFSVRCLRD